jgi:hypothetical protein
MISLQIFNKNICAATDDDGKKREFPASFRMEIRYWVSRYAIIQEATKY